VSFWITDRMLPGLASSAIWAAVLWVSHRRLRRHVDQLTQRQTDHIDRLTERQTADLTPKPRRRRWRR
jgi:hypothetical protein